MNTIYFQPKGINPKHCEVGTIINTDPDYIYFLNYPCKVLISECKIIEKDRVTYNKKKKLHYVTPHPKQ